MSKPTCPTDCTSYLADYAFSTCSPEWYRGQIDRIYLYGIGDPVVADPAIDPAGFVAEMAARVSNTSADANAIRILTVIGEKPEPETNTIQLSNNRTIVTSKKHTVSFKIDELTQENRDAMRQWECGNSFLIMYENDGLLFGGDPIGAGIEASLVGNLIIPVDRTAVDYIQGTLTWESKFSPNSIENPLD